MLLRTVLNLSPSWPRHKSPCACCFLMSRRVCYLLCQALRKPGMSQRCLCCRRQRVGWETSEKLCAQDFLLGVALRFTRPQFISLAALPYPQFVSECEQVLFLCVLAELWCFCGGCTGCASLVVMEECECCHHQQALLAHTGVILPCSCLGRGLDGVFKTRRAEEHVEVFPAVVESFWTCRENKAVKTKKETDVRSLM